MNYDEMIKILDGLQAEGWEQLPKIKLIISQLVEIIDEQHLGSRFFDEEKYKGSMVNHFAKKGIVPRAEGKKYGKEHLAANTVCAMLKQVLTLENMIPLMTNCCGDGEILEVEKIKDFYGKFLKNSVKEKQNIMADLKLIDENDRESICDIAINFAIRSYMNQLACKIIIESILKEKK